MQYRIFHEAKFLQNHDSLYYGKFSWKAKLIYEHQAQSKVAIVYPRDTCNEWRPLSSYESKMLMLNFLWIPFDCEKCENYTPPIKNTSYTVYDTQPMQVSIWF